MNEIFPDENRRVPEGQQLMCRIWGPRPRTGDPRWVREAIQDALSHNEVRMFEGPELKTRNDHRQNSTFILQEAVRALHRYDSDWTAYRYHKAHENEWRGWSTPQRPYCTRKELLVRLDVAWRYYKEWT